MIVRNVHSGSGYQIASIKNNAALVFAREDLVSEAVSDAQMLARFVLGKIDEKDGMAWPNWKSEEEARKAFWQDYVSELPNVLIAAEVLMT